MGKINESIYGMYQKWSSGNMRKEDQHSYVDLGLPSGLLWATCNIGGDTSDDKGDKFFWGSVNSDDETNKYVKSRIDIKKYNHEDSLTVLEPEDDAANIIWKDNWRMPTKDDVEELINNTKYEPKVINGVSCWSFKSNKNELIIPAYNIWTSSISKSAPRYAYCLTSMLSITALPKVAVSDRVRMFIRPVKDNK